MMLFYKGKLVILIPLLLVVVAAIAINPLINKTETKVIPATNLETQSTETEVLLDEDPWAEIEKVIIAYENPAGMQYTGSIQLIDDNGVKEKVLEETDFAYTLLDNDHYYYKVNNLEYVNKKEFALFVDHNSETIAFSRHAFNHSITQPFNIVSFKKLITERKGDVRVSKINNDRIISIDEIQDPSIQGYRIYYSASDYRIRKVEIGMLRISPLSEETVIEEEALPEDNPKATENAAEDLLQTYAYRLIISYSSISPLTLEKRLFAPEKTFISFISAEPVLAEGFKHYTLVNGSE